MDYFVMSQEYLRDSKKILKTMRKYEARLNGCRKENLEKLNSIIASYRYIYYDLLNTAKLLRERAEKYGNINTEEKENENERENTNAA